jgi:hypothetical protein
VDGCGDDVGASREVGVFSPIEAAACVLPSRYVSITVKFGTFAESKILNQCSGFSWEFVLSNG